MANNAVFTPAVGTLTTTEGDITGTTVSANEEWSCDLRLTNKQSGAVSYRVAIGDGTSYGYESYDGVLGANTSIDILRGRKLPAGWRLKMRAGANSSIDYTFSGTKRSTL